MPPSRIVAAGLRAIAAAAVGLRARVSRTQAAVVLCYHGVAESDGDTPPKLSAPIARRQFERQLRHLRRWYRIVPAADVQAAAAGRRRGGRFPVALTFDDDLPSHVHVAAGILRMHESPATFFLSGGDTPYWWQLLERAWDAGALDGRLLSRWGIESRGGSLRALASELQRMPATQRDAFISALAAAVGDPERGERLSTADVAALVRSGFDIGFHTRDHYDLTTLSDAELDAALRVGRAELETVCGRIAMIAYPHGGGDRRVAEAAGAADFSLGFLADGSVVRPDANPLLLGRRYPISGSIGDFALGLARAFSTARSA